MKTINQKKPTSKCVNTRDTFSRQRGLSLVEIMVAVAISMFLLGGVIQVFLGSKQSYTVNQGLSRLQENARFAFDRIAQDISAAGYTGCNESDGVDRSGQPLIFNSLTDTASIAYDFINPVTGENNTGPNASDKLHIRRAITATAVPFAAEMFDGTSDIQLDDTHPNYAALEQWQLMAVSDCHMTSIFMITNDPTISNGLIKHDANLVSPVGQPNAGQSNLATLYKGVDVNDLKNNYGSENSSQATSFRIATNQYDIQPSQSGNGMSLYLNGTEMIEGVQDMQVLYGMNDDGLDGVDRYVEVDDAALAAAGMNSVASIRISLTMNTVENINIEGQAPTKVVTQTFRLRNR